MIEVRNRDGRARACKGAPIATPAVAVIDDGGDTAKSVLGILGERALRIPAAAEDAFGLQGRGTGPRLVPIGPDHLAAAGLPQAGRDPVGFISSLVLLREAAGPNALLHVPHAATPHTLPLLAYTGADTFGPGEVVRESLRGGRFTPYALVEAPGDHLGEGLRLMADAADAVRDAISGGYLRELVEATAPLTTSGAACLRALDLEHFAYFEACAPVHRPRGILAGDRSLTRPEVLRFQRRVVEQVELPPYEVLLVLPCSARKPYSRSPSHRRFIEAIERAGAGRAVQELIATSPFGLVPREIERLYPASAYDIPVTGHWTADERIMLTALLGRFLERHSYDAVVMHLPEHMAFLRDAAPDPVWTSDGAPGSGRSLAALTETLSRIAPERPRGQAEAAFGAAVSMFFPDAKWLGSFRARGPAAVDGGAALVRLTDRPHLTMAGGTRLMASGYHRVSIDDFAPTGSVLAPGVLDCSPEVRPGDEVAVVHGDELRAVGTAAMSAAEMVLSSRGVAVRVKGHR